MSTKTERLLNLFFLLLNSSRPLNRSEIKNRIEDYKSQDSEVAFERMFERDKDELRQLGIDIEVKSIDPFFEDELGYRILPSSYALNIHDLSSKELALLSLAAAFWRDSSMSQESQKALRKLEP